MSVAIAPLTRRALLGGGAAAGLVLAGCAPGAGGESQGSTTPRRGGRLRLGVVDGERSGNLDAHKPANTGASTIRGFAMYAKLWEWSNDMLPQLALAESSELAKDGKSCTLRLLKGLEFHHGKSISADDVIFSIRRLTDPKLASPYGALVRPVDRERIDRLDDRTVRVHFRGNGGFVALPDTWTNFGGIVPTDYHPVTNPVGAGPFLLEKAGDFIPGERILLKRFPNYFRTGKPYPDELEIVEFKDHMARVAALLSGQVDMANALLPEQAELVRNDPHTRVVVSQTDTWNSFDINTARPPFTDPRVRQAFRLLANRPELVARALRGEGRVANDLYSPHDPLFDHSIGQRPHDVKQAKALLRAAGIDRLNLEFVTNPVGTSAALIFAQQLREADIHLNVRQVDLATFSGPDRFSWPISTGGTLGLPWLATALHQDAPSAVNNKTQFHDPEFAQLFGEAIAEVDIPRRAQLVHQLQHIQYERGGQIIWGFSNIQDGISRKIGGVTPEHSHFPTWRFDRIWV